MIKYKGISTLEVLVEAKNYNRWIADEIQSHISSPALEMPILFSGVFSFEAYFSTNVNQNAQIRFDVYTRTAGGTETLIASTLNTLKPIKTASLILKTITNMHLLTQKKQELEEELRRLEAPGAGERQAKERLNLKLPGEEVTVVISEKKPGELSATTSSQGWWNRIRLWFSNFF